MNIIIIGSTNHVFNVGDAQLFHITKGLYISRNVAWFGQDNLTYIEGIREAMKMKMYYEEFFNNH